MQRYFPLALRARSLEQRVDSEDSGELTDGERS